ncbi:MAG: SUMF1/EgtB/PvdO family nonheme iron enzyme, partial [Treponema sp.]|nr:SUMF1/EgtB/PvdO family nonheme iron enzyme [Treponema sp.]
NVGSVAWYSVNSGSKTHEVKGLAPISAGIYDMSGNVWEWCWDLDSSSYRVFRGGSWDNSDSDCEVSSRSYTNPDYRGRYYGFRVVRNAN